ncbi:hypothetical protein C8R44DRAFT_749426 [Mycena epipterygia]|nr:hypothetical protein C8R44DRAFT_749426 [Mycena epipterygia]
MYCWLEQNECKHTELMCIIARFRHDSAVWVGWVECEEELKGGVDGTATFARMQTTMYQHNVEVVFQECQVRYTSSATTFDELITKINEWCEVVFKWMDEMLKIWVKLKCVGKTAGSR